MIFVQTILPYMINCIALMLKLEIYMIADVINHPNIDM